MTEFDSLFFTPIMPISKAEIMDPIIDPVMTSYPSRSASAAPANDISEIPCTAKA